jgi:hypothetical protein
MSPFFVDVDSLEEGVKLTDVLADYDKFQFGNQIKPDYCNAGGIQMLDGAGEWVDWYDEETGEDDPKVFLKGRGKAGAIYRGISLSGLTTLTDKIVMVGGTKE